MKRKEIATISKPKPFSRFVTPATNSKDGFLCSLCKRWVTVVWEIGSFKHSCFDCLYPHEQARMINDELTGRLSHGLGIKRN